MTFGNLGITQARSNVSISPSLNHAIIVQQRFTIVHNLCMLHNPTLGANDNSSLPVRCFLGRQPGQGTLRHDDRGACASESNGQWKEIDGGLAFLVNLGMGKDYDSLNDIFVWPEKRRLIAAPVSSEPNLFHDDAVGSSDLRGSGTRARLALSDGEGTAKHDQR